ncbi:DNA polymerase III subunit gamma/tau [Candidatus Peregrinibacteria bacterium]|nr:DNA polymerase III subunit gamma/tau [Candidatus Peregrinibacteria bacterium]
MEEISLYRKYRPHNFDNLVGQEHIKSTLINALKSGHVAHAYLFTGPRGTGKTSTARLIAKALSCTELKEDFEPCNECEFCKDINEGRLIDLIEVDAASNRGIDEVRDLKEKIQFAPTRAKYKIYIIDEVHMMTKEAFNALLKTLEEPPSHAYFILATTEVHKIPETIISRCQRFDFKRIGEKTLMTRLSFIAQKEKIEAEDSALEAISRYVDGGLRDAIGLLEQLNNRGKLSFEHVQDILGVSDHGLLEQLFNALLRKDAKEALALIHDLHGQGSDLRQFTHEFIDMLRTKMLDSVNADQTELTQQLITMIEVFQEAQKKLEYGIPQLALEIAVIKIADDGRASVAKGPAKAPEVPVVEKKEVQVPSPVQREHQTLDQKPTLDLATIKSYWPRITERVKTPSLRMSLKNGSPVLLNGYDLSIEFSTNFHRDKVMEHEHRVELEEILKELLGHGIKIVATVKSIEIQPVVEEKDDLVGAALDIFGGELVD